MPTATRAKRRAERLLKALSGAERLLILMHNNPDPDSIGASLGLQHLYAKKVGLEAVIAYGGILGRAENRAMIRHLDIAVQHFRDISVESFPVVALVDTQPGTGNNLLPADRKPDIVIDHHPARERQAKIAFSCIATHYGATSSIVASCLTHLGVEIDSRVATGLLYGIKADTNELAARAGSHDHVIYLDLFAKADLDLLGQIENAEVPREYYEDIQKTLGQAVVRGKMVFSDIGTVKQPDMVAEMADFFMRLEDIRWSICVGSFGRDVFLSVRTADKRKHANWLATRLVKDLGSGGGHGSMAGGRIPMTSELSLEQIRAEVKRRAIEILNLRRRREYKLVRESVQNNHKGG